MTFELAYTLSGLDRTDITVLDDMPGTFISASPVPTNFINGSLYTVPNSPTDTVPFYTDNYAYWNDLTLTNGQTKIVEITLQLPSTKCSSTALSNQAFVSINPYGNADEDAIIYPIITSAAPGEENTAVTYLDPDTQEEDISNNTSEEVDLSIP